MIQKIKDVEYWNDTLSKIEHNVGDIISKINEIVEEFNSLEKDCEKFKQRMEYELEYLQKRKEE